MSGMRERAELLGGRLEAGPTADGFRVELWLPELVRVSSEPIRVMLADDQRVVREGLTLILDLLEGVEVVDTASDGERGGGAGRAARPRRRPDGPADAAARRDRGDPPARARAGRGSG